MKLNLKQTLVGLVLTLCLMAAGATGWALHSIRLLNAEIAGLTIKHLPTSALLGRIETTTATHRIRQFRYMSSETDEVRVGSLDMMHKEEAQLRQLLASYAALATAEEVALLDRFKAAWAANEAAWAEVVRLDREVGHVEALRHFRGEGLRVYEAALAALEEGVAFNHGEARAASEAAVAVSARATAVTVASLAGLLVVSLASILVSLLRIARPIDRMTAMMARLSSGDTAVEVTGRERGDEIGAMARAVQVFKDNLIRARSLEEVAARARTEAEAARIAGEAEAAALR